MNTKVNLSLLARTAVLVGAALFVSACAKDVHLRGNEPLPESLAELAPGEQTRQDVQALLGTPSTTSVFGGETWYYISAHTTQYAFYPVHELDRTVHVLNFDDRGILTSARVLTLEDGQEIDVSQRTTPTKGREYSLIEQLIGNIGRFGTQSNRRGPGTPSQP